MSFKKTLALLIVVVLCISGVLALTSCPKPNPNDDDPATSKPEEITTKPENDKNETDTLIIQTLTFDKVFSPFFYSNAYDGDVVGLVSVGLLSMNRVAEVVAGDDYDTVAKSYSIYYTDNLDTYAKKDTYEEGDYVVYDMVIKNGMKFSDGTAITAEDVLFNYYVYLDPAYEGSTTLYTLPILGLTDYRTQVQNADAVYAKAYAMFNKGEGYTVTDEDNFTQAEYDNFWNEIIPAQGKIFANEIVKYVAANYITATYADEFPKPVEEMKANEGLKIAAGMSMWGFGEFPVKYAVKENGAFGLVDGAYKTLYAVCEEDKAMFADADGKFYTKKTNESTEFVYITGRNDDGTYKVTAYTGDLYDVDGYVGSFVSATGKTFDLVNEFPTVDEYWDALIAGYSDFDDEGKIISTDYANLSSTETAGALLEDMAAEVFTLKGSNIGSIANIRGIVKGETTIDDVKYETVKVILTEQNPKAILSLGVTVAPKSYYAAGYEYTEGAVVNHGVELGINGNNKFMKHLHKADLSPRGAGTYKFVSEQDGLVTFVRNEYHETMGGANVYNAVIKNVAMKVVETGKEFQAIQSGDVHYAEVSATADVMSDLKKEVNLKFTPKLVDNLGYGYICINPAAENLHNLNTRIALTTVLNLEAMKDYYPEGLADVIYRAQSQVSWSYPEGAEAIYPYDATLASAIENFKKAGYNFDDATGKFTDVPEFDFFLPSDASEHPAGKIFLTAKDNLEKIGVTANIKVDKDLIANIKKNAVGVYALAWSSSADPDMYQVYHYESQAESVISNGIKWLQANGNKDELGIIEVTKRDGSKVPMNQTQALEYLAELIEEGVKYMSVQERQPIYEKALEVLAQLNIEIPTYQRKNLFVFDNTVIDSTSLSANITPYWGPLAEIWKVSFTK